MSSRKIVTFGKSVCRDAARCVPAKSRRRFCGKPSQLFFLSVLLVFVAAFSCAAAKQKKSERSPGEQLFVSKCSACHPRPDRKKFDAAGWEKTIGAHKDRVPLSEEQKKNLLEFLGGD